MKRIVMCNKDVQRLIGKSSSTAAILLSRIRRELNKPASKPVTVEDFCSYMGLSLKVVLKQLG